MPDDEPIHQWFELSYANYLVLPRTLLQSMPVAWQRRFVACLTEMRDAFAHVEQAPGYRVEPAVERTLRDLSADELESLGIEAFDDDADGCAGETCERNHERFCDADGREREGWERVMVPIAEDPVPHYDRGRTRVPTSLPTMD